MTLAVRQVSRFVVGTALMREHAIKASGIDTITFVDVADQALTKTPEGRRVMTSIETLADNEAAWFRNTPPHALASERVVQTRSAEIAAFGALHKAMVGTVEHADTALQGDAGAKDALQGIYVEALRAIDLAPGSAQERRHLLTHLREGVRLVAPDNADGVTQMLRNAETAYMDRRSAEILARYENTLERSNDFEM